MIKFCKIRKPDKFVAANGFGSSSAFLNCAASTPQSRHVTELDTSTVGLSDALNLMV